MKFQKGQSGNPNGRPKGTATKVSQGVKAVIGLALENIGDDTLIAKLMEIDDPKDFINCYAKLAEFIEPKMRSIDMPQIDKVSNPVIDMIKEIRNEKNKKE